MYISTSKRRKERLAGETRDRVQKSAGSARASKYASKTSRTEISLSASRTSSSVSIAKGESHHGAAEESGGKHSEFGCVLQVISENAELGPQQDDDHQRIEDSHHPQSSFDGWSRA